MSRPLQVAFHVGVHGTDEERLFRSLRQNADLLVQHGVELCENAVNEPILNEALSALKGGVAPPEMEDIILDALIESDAPHRLIMSRPTFLGMPALVFNHDGLMLYAGPKMANLARVLPSTEVEFFIALRNPATMLCHMITRNRRGYDALMGSTDPMTKRWGPALAHAVDVLRGQRIVVWAHEDMSLIFPDVLRKLAGLPPESTLKGDDRMLRSLLTVEGVHALRAQMQPDMPRETRQEVTESLLAEFGNAEALAMQIDLPGWTQDLVAEMTAAYHEDLAMIAAIPEVEFITA